LQAKGEFALLNQNLTTAQYKPGQPVKNGTMAHDHHLYMLLADAATQQRDENALRQYALRLEELAIRDSHTLYLGIAHRAWGVAHRLANEHDKASKRLTQALELFSGLDTRWQIGRTLFEMGELEAARGEKDSAQDHFSRAQEAFEAMKAMPNVEQTRRALESLQSNKIVRRRPRSR
jgi:tetratricopeptide (TPR) repeat protein